MIKVRIILTMLLEGVVIYTFLSNLAVGLISFHAAGVPMLSIKSIGLSVVFSAMMSALFYIFTIWAKRSMLKRKEISFPFAGIQIPDMDVNSDEIELDIEDIEEIKDE